MEERKILVVEDDKYVRESIKLILERKKYKVVLAEDGKEAIEIFKNEEFSLIIMDLMLPKLQGEEVIVQIRKESYCPIIILSAKSENFHKVVGFNLGADDYLTKPFSDVELIARVNSLIRRTYSYKKEENLTDDNIIVDSICLNTKEKCAYVDGEKKNLTSIEYSILKLLMTHPNRVFSSSEIYELVWNYPPIDTKTVSVHIKRIRDKIEIDSKKPRYIKVVWGFGYKFVC